MEIGCAGSDRSLSGLAQWSTSRRCQVYVRTPDSALQQCSMIYEELTASGRMTQFWRTSVLSHLPRITVFRHPATWSKCVHANQQLAWAVLVMWNVDDSCSQVVASLHLRSAIT